MLSLKLVFGLLVGANILALLSTGVSIYYRDPSQTISASTEPSIPQFDEPSTAYYILKQLDIFQNVPGNGGGAKYGEPIYGLINDDLYCEKHRALVVENPEFIFTQKNFITNYGPSTLVRSLAIKRVGNDLQPQVGAHMTKKQQSQPSYDLRPNATIFFTLGGIHGEKSIGKNFACTSQVYNQILGHSSINRKDNIAKAVVEYSHRYADRPQCFNFDKFFPETWVLTNQTQCTEFFKKFNSPQYKKEKEEKTIVYIRKLGSGSHQAKGVQPVNDEEEEQLRKMYKNGELCGKTKDNYVIQTYVYNPLLLNGHKFDFRVYMVVASTNPTILYYHDGFLRVSLHPYDVKSNDKSVLLTNTALSNKIFDIAREQGHYQGLNETELRNFQMWNLERLQDYLLQHKKITDSNWLDNYLRPEFKKAMIHLIRMVSGPFVKLSQLYELYGTDFMLDDNLNLWFIECNSGPVLSGSSEEKEKFVTKMLADQFEIVSGLLKSRMKRIINYVNKITHEGKARKLPSNEVYIVDLEQRQKEFQEIIKNRFEPEYEPSKGNGFSKIIDENYSGVEKYAGLISAECM